MDTEKTGEDGRVMDRRRDRKKIKDEKKKKITNKGRKREREK
jgi:hypothetical protein